MGSYAVSARQVDLHRLYNKYMLALTSSERTEARKAYQREMRRQQAVESAYRRFVEFMYPGDEAKQELMMTAPAGIPKLRRSCILNRARSQFSWRAGRFDSCAARSVDSFVAIAGRRELWKGK